MSFPVDVEIENWFNQAEGGGWSIDSPGGEWIQGLAVKTGGAGVGIAIVMSFAMIFSWFSYCCCSRCCSQSVCCCKRSGAKSLKARLVNSWKLFLGYFLCILAAVICAILMNAGARQSVKGMDRGFDGVVRFAEETQGFICTASRTRQDLALSAKDTQTSSTLLSTYEDQCIPGSIVNLIANTNSRVVGVVKDARRLIDGVSEAVSSNLTAADSSAHVLSTSVDTMAVKLGEIDTFATSIRDTAATLPAFASTSPDVPDVGTNLNEISAATSALSTAMTSITGAKENADAAINQLSNDVTTELDQAQVDITSALVDFSSEAVSGMESMRTLEMDMRNASTDTITPTMRDVFIASVTALPFIAVFAFLVGACGSGAGGKKASLTGASIVFVFLFWVAVFAGLCGVFGFIFEDVCANREMLLRTNLDSTVTIDGVEVQVGQKANEVLHCGMNPGADTPQTFAHILGLESVFNRTSDLDPVFKSLDEASASVTASTASLDSSIISLEAAISDFNLPVSSGSGEYDIAPLFTQISAAHAQCQQLSGTSQTDCTAKVDSMQADATAMQAAIDSLYALKNASVDSATELLGALTSITGPIDGVATDARLLKNSTQSIVEFVATIPAETQCQFVGRAYNTIVDVAVCDEVTGSFKTVYIAGVCTAVVMFLGFLWVLLPWRNIEDESNDVLNPLNGSGLPMYHKNQKPAQQGKTAAHPLSP